MNKDNLPSWINEDDEDEISSVAPAPVATAPAQPQKPNVAADPVIPGLALPKPQVAPTAATVAQSESEAKSVLAEIDAELPANYMECFPILNALKAKLPEKTPAQQKVKAARIARVRQHIYDVQQVPKLKVIPQEHVKAMGISVTMGAKRRGERLEKYQEAIAANNWTAMPVTPRAGIDAAIKSALADEGIKAKVATLRAALVKYGVQFLENWAIISPRQRLKELQLAISAPIDFVTAQAFTDELIRLSHPYAGTIAASTRAVLMGQYAETCKPLIVDLLASVIAHIESAKASALQAEKAFFQSQGAKPETTSVSKKHDIILKHLREQHSRIANPPSAPFIAPSAAQPEDSPLTTTLGVQVIEP